MALLSIVTMGAGIGASAMLFALVDGIVLRPLPYPEPDRLVRIFDLNPQAGIPRAGAASGNLDDWRRRVDAFDGLAGYYSMGRTVSVDGDADVLITAQVTRDFFQVFGLAPLLGRVFTEDEILRATFNGAAAPVGSDPVVMLSHRVWTQRFGRDPHVIGRTLALDRRPFRIVGVMPAAFAIPEAAELWIPWYPGSAPPRDQHFLVAVARLQRGVSLPVAEERLNAVARALADEHPATNRGWSVQLSPLATETVGEAATLLWTLLAAVGLLLLIACANVALLALMRGLDRSDETAVRLALGATTPRLLREFLFESLLMAAAGGALGVAVAHAGLRLLPALTTDLPRMHEVTLDGRVLLFVAATTVLAAVVSGLVPAWRRARAAGFTAITSASTRMTAGRERRWLRDGIVVGQVALAMVLLVAASLLVRSVLQLRAVDPGFAPQGVLVAPVFLDSQAYGDGEKVRTYYRTLFERLSALPGVRAVGGATSVPTGPLGPDFERPVWPQGAPLADEARLQASVRIVTPDYLAAMGLRVVEGRAIDDRDAPDAPRVLMVSETLARRLWPGQRAVGQQLVVDYSISGTYPYEIVGVIGDIRFKGPRSEPLAEIYIPHAQRSYLVMNVVVRADGDPRALTAAVREALRDVDPQKPAHGIYALDDLIDDTYVRDRQAMVAVGVFAGAAVFLAVLAIYGALAQRVRERAREIGIRVAVGASRAAIVGWVAAAGVRLIALGVVIGLVIARLAGGVLERLLFGVAPGDALSVIAAATMLMAVGLLATLMPSWRATRIDPIDSLRRG